MSHSKHFYMDANLADGAFVVPPEGLAKRLCRVMRLKAGDEVALFNGNGALFAAVLLDDKARKLKVGEKIKDEGGRPEVTLFCALLKKEAFDRVLRQATEMGVTRIVPLFTEFSVPDKLNLERAHAVVVEAAEQCERLDVPELVEPAPLKEGLDGFGGQIFWCAEHLFAVTHSGASLHAGGKWGDYASKSGDGVLVGPEGGFSEGERAWLAAQKNITPVGLGVTILKADTAVVAALSRFYNQLC